MKLFSWVYFQLHHLKWIVNIGSNLRKEGKSEPAYPYYRTNWKFVVIIRVVNFFTLKTPINNPKCINTNKIILKEYHLQRCFQIHQLGISNPVYVM